MRFGVLGPVAVWTCDGRSVGVPGLKVRALLADLLVYEGRPVPADRLIDDIWGERPPADPAAALSVKASQLRRVLEDAEPGGRGLVIHGPAGYRLVGETDAAAFRAMLAKAADSADPQARAELLAEALGCWRGSAFADFADEPFAAPLAAQLTEMRLTALEDSAQARLELGEHAALVGDLAAVLAEHPLRERLRAAHMRALYRAGRQGEALASYQELRALLADELGIDPGGELTALHHRILTQDPALAAPVARAGNLPELITGLVGRDDAVAEVLTLTGTDRLVTLSGPGGVGKTRLAIATAARLAASFPDGVWLVELAALDRPAAADAVSRVAEAVMAVLGVGDGDGAATAPVDRLADVLRARRLLLVLDNCEHVIEPVAELVDALLKAVPTLRLLATSQEPLALAGEAVWSVPPLDVPDRGADLDAVRESAAVRLFVERAAAADRSFTLDAASAEAAGVLCRRLDGIPLALELAATRVRTLGVHGLVERLDDRFRLLATGHRGAPPRQRTLLAMIDWSWELLSEPERIVLRRLAVHVDGCTLDAAEYVCAEDGLHVLDQLARLVDRSLVVVVDGAGGPRYLLLESVAAYCAERLHDAGETEPFGARHQRFYTELAERGEPQLRGAEQKLWLRRLDADTANLRAALDAAVRGGDASNALRLANALSWYWFLRGRLAEARRSLDAALRLEGAPSALRAQALAWRAGIGLLHGDHIELAERAERGAAALALFGDVDPAGLARAQWFLAYTATDAGDLAAAAELIDKALSAFAEVGDTWGMAAALATRAKLAHIAGDLDAIERDARRSAELFGELGDRWGIVEATGWLAAAAEMAGDYERAEAEHRDGMRLSQELELWAEVAGRTAWLGWLALQRGDLAAASTHSERALRLATAQGHRAIQVFARIGVAFAARRDGRLDLAHGHLRDMLAGVSQKDAETAPPPYLPMIMAELGFVEELRGDAAAALAAHRESIEASARFANAREVTIAVDGLAGALALMGLHEQSARLLGWAHARRAAGEWPAAPIEQVDADRIGAVARAALGADGFAAHHADGARLTRDEVLAVAAGAATRYSASRPS